MERPEEDTILNDAMGSRPGQRNSSQPIHGMLEKQAIMTVPLDYKPRFWMRYVDDAPEKLKAVSTQNLTQHLNTIIEPIGSIICPWAEGPVEVSFLWHFDSA